jgi:hypothetical protein
LIRELLGKVLPHAVRSRIKDLLRMPQVERSVALKGEVQFWRNWLSTTCGPGDCDGASGGFAAAALLE